MRSRLLEGIEAKLTGVKKYSPPSIAKIKVSDPTPCEVKEALECSISVTLGATVLIDAELMHSSEDPTQLILYEKRKLGRHIAEYVYGDIRKRLFDLALEIRRLDGNHKSLIALDKIIDLTEYPN